MSQASECSNIQAQVVVAETVTVGSKGEFMLRGKVRGGVLGRGDYIFLVDQENLGRRGIGAACSIHTLLGEESEFITIRIINPGATEVKLYRGTKLGEVECLSSPTSDHRICTIDNDNEGCSSKVIEEVLRRHQTILNKEELHSLSLILKDYCNVFSVCSTDLGCAQEYKHEIDTGHCPAVAQGPRRLDMHIEEEVERLVEDLVRKDIIEPCHSPWNSPIVVIRKKCGAIRMCVDFRRLNAISRRPIYPIPDSKQLFDSLGGANYFSTLDLSMGYYQIPLKNGDIEKTAFTTRTGQYQFKRMPFGLSGAPATFQRVMSDILREFNWKACVIYLDDILVFGRTLQEHNERLVLILKRFSQAGLKLAPLKCHFMRKEVKYLGHLMNKDGVQTDPEKIETITSWPKPSNHKELHTFIGLCGYYRRFIHDYASVIKPLEILLQKSAGTKGIFEWTGMQEISFINLKRKLTEAPILAYPNKEDLFILDTDASENSIGAVLSQVQNGEEKVISYASNQLSKAERSYCTTRRELLAVYKYVKQFRHYLIGKQFKIRTDHRALVWMLGWDNPNTSQYASWKAELDEYDFQVEHRPGKTHINADSLSRRPCGQCELKHENPRRKRNVKTFEEHQDGKECLDIDHKMEDSVENVMQAMRDNKWQHERLPTQLQSSEANALWKLRRNLRIRGDKLFLLSTVNKYLEIPTTIERQKLIGSLHKDTGHGGVEKCMKLIKDLYYWPKMEIDVRLEVAKCLGCAIHKRSYERMTSCGSLASQYPFHMISIDITELSYISKDGYRYILGIVDNFSRYPMLVPVKETSATTIARALVTNWFSIFGVPEVILSDNGTSFKNRLVQALCDILDIKKAFSTPYYPQGDGMVERLFGTVKPIIKIISEEKGIDWPETIPLIEMAMRTSHHSSTGFTPSEAIFGKIVNNVFLSRTGRVPIKAYENCGKYLEDVLVQTKVIEKSIKAKQSNVPQHNPDFKVGELVLVKAVDRNAPARYEGPYKVMRNLGSFAHLLLDEERGITIKRNRKFLKRFMGDTLPMTADRHTSLITNNASHQRQSLQPIPGNSSAEPRQRQSDCQGQAKQQLRRHGQGKRYPERQRKEVCRYQ